MHGDGEEIHWQIFQLLRLLKARLPSAARVCTIARCSGDREQRRLAHVVGIGKYAAERVGEDGFVATTGINTHVAGELTQRVRSGYCVSAVRSFMMESCELWGDRTGLFVCFDVH